MSKGAASERFKWLLPAVAISTLSASSVSYLDDDGIRHVVGWVDLAMPTAASSGALAGDFVDITTIGVALTNTAQGTSLSLGYSRDVVGSLLDDKAVVFHSPQLLDKRE
jgi:hypothetical protein